MAALMKFVKVLAITRDDCNVLLFKARSIEQIDNLKSPALFMKPLVSQVSFALLYLLFLFRNISPASGARKCNACRTRLVFILLSQNR